MTRAKYGYLSTYEEILNRISSGKLNTYDIVFLTDTQECFVINEEQIPIPIKSRVNTYTSVESAQLYINQSTMTYEGQLVAVKNRTRFKAYIVSKNESGSFYLTSLDNTDVDYDTLGNRPVINIIGTSAIPIYISDLPIGIYHVKGQYYHSHLDSTVNLAMSDVLVIVGADGFQKMNGSQMIKFTYSDNGEAIGDEYVTKSYLKSQLFTQILVEQTVQATENKIYDVLSDDAIYVGNEDINNLFKS